MRNSTLRAREPAFMAALRIMIVDDHDVVRRVVKSLLETHSNWQVIGEAAAGPEAVEQAAKLRPDVVVLDYRLPSMDGVEAGRRILETLPQTEILMLTYDDSPFLLEKALESGIRGFVLKSDANRDLLPGVTAVSEHRSFLSSRASKNVSGGSRHSSSPDSDGS